MHLGLVGLATMGANLARNAARNGVSVVVYNRTADRTDEFLRRHAGEGALTGAHSLKELCAALPAPRVVLLMVKAGEAVDAVIAELLPHLQKGDILIDGGNSAYRDTERRSGAVAKSGVRYIGLGVSGGEEGALRGPSLMPGGDRSAYDHVEPMLRLMAADDGGGNPCVAYCGPGGAGHFVKMVHNGIEYGVMQIIAETVDVLRSIGGYDLPSLTETFNAWRQMPETESFLLDVTAQVLGYVDPASGQRLLDVVDDAAGQKGTGKWTGIEALELGIPLTLIGEAVFARCLSAIKEERVEASKVLPGPKPKFEGDRKAFVEDVRKALFASKMVSYAQGYTLMRAAAKERGWNLNYGGVALMWRGGCIIRSVFLGKIKEAFDKDPGLTNLLLDPFFRDKVVTSQDAWRRVVSTAILNGVPVPAFATALNYFDGFRAGRLPANLLQAQRDYFGAHTYERTDQPRGKFFHTNWTGRGGTTSASTYTV